MTKTVIEGVVPPFGRSPWGKDALEIEDGGQAVIATLSNDPDAEDGFFVQLRSWTKLSDRYRFDNPDLPFMHDFMSQIAGKKVRVTVEVVDEDIRD